MCQGPEILLRVQSCGMSDWDIELLRFTAFPSAPAQADQELWSAVSGSRPDDIQLRPQEGAGLFSGPCLDGSCKLSLIVSPERIDWLLTAQEAGKEEPSIPSAGPFKRRSDEFSTLLSKWFGHAPHSVRVALGAVLFVRVPSISDGLKLLAPMLPNVRLSLDELDFALAVNRPRASRTLGPKVRINRLTKWSAVTVQRLLLLAHVGAGSAATFRTPTVQSSENHARLEIDFNTAGDEAKPLLSESGKLELLFRELMDLAKETVAKGDVP